MVAELEGIGCASQDSLHRTDLTVADDSQEFLRSVHRLEGVESTLEQLLECAEPRCVGGPVGEPDERMHEWLVHDAVEVATDHAEELDLAFAIGGAPGPPVAFRVGLRR